LEGKLSPTVEREIERHMSNCPDCRLVLDAATTTLDKYFAIAGTAEGEGSTKAA
jgi:predicted anti-sigma-YlaC factor YlaD